MTGGGGPYLDPWDNPPRLPPGFNLPPRRDIDPGFAPRGGTGTFYTDAPDILGPGVRHVRPGDPRIKNTGSLGKHPVLHVAERLVGRGFDPQTALRAALGAFQRPVAPPSGYGRAGEGWQAQVDAGGPDPYMTPPDQVPVRWSPIERYPMAPRPPQQGGNPIMRLLGLE